MKQSSWTYTAANGDKYEVRVTVASANVTVAIRPPTGGDPVIRRGRLVVDRVLREGPGERITERITGATVSSLLGDVVGKDRTIRGAAEDYASKVLRTVVDGAVCDRHASGTTCICRIHTSPFDCLAPDGTARRI